MALRSGKARCATWLVSAFALAVMTTGAGAQDGPFSHYTGGWSGSGKITLKNGSTERIRCRASYDANSGGNAMQIMLRCASDSYKFEFGGNAQAQNGNLSGNWTEMTRRAAGRFSGRVHGDRISARAEGQTFTALLDMTTTANNQRIVIRSPGSQLSAVSIALRRHRR